MTRPKSEATCWTSLDARRAMSAYIDDLQRRICRAFEALDTAAFERRTWQREGGGGGTIALMRGTVFEKVGVNCSTVWGEADEDLARRMGARSTTFYASGLSLVAHMANPFVPAVHLNIRYVEMGRPWFGGGADLTPYLPFEDDIRDFHAALKSACDRHDPEYYHRFARWCDEYFFLPHRNEPRGAGGIFFDYLDDRPLDALFAFTREVGETFLDVYPRIVARRTHLPFTPEQRAYQLQRRGRYVEFNLLYDRGTAFGLKTKGDVEGILMSLPPIVTW